MFTQDVRKSERRLNARDRLDRDRGRLDRDSRGRDGRRRGSSWRHPPESYWAQARRPLHGLVFVIPLLATYELGVAWLGGASAAAVRSGADAWVRRGLATVGQTDRWFPPLAIVLALLAWESFTPRNWRLSAWCLAGMALESLILAMALVGLGRAVYLGFAHLETHAILSAPSPDPDAGPIGPPSGESRERLVALVGYLGAGVYEEALFRLAILSILYGAARLLLLPRAPALALAMTASALAFSLAHHAGAPGEPFTWYAFIFRWSAGIVFSWIFLARGFGIAVGTHVAYDVLVALIGWTT